VFDSCRALRPGKVTGDHNVGSAHRLEQLPPRPGNAPAAARHDVARLTLAGLLDVLERPGVEVSVG
jgi:hypothetical protein